MKKQSVHLIPVLVVFFTSMFINTSVASGSSSGTGIEGVYTTTFRAMTLTTGAGIVSGTYEGGNGKLTGVLNGNTLSGTWTNSASKKKGRFEFVFNEDFSAFTGKYGYDNSAPGNKWNGTKTGSSGSSVHPPPTQTALPVNVIGSWSANGSRNHRGRLNIWQNGNDFVIIVSWIDEERDLWKSYKGEGRFEGRQMNFKVFPSSADGTSVDQGYVYHYTISPDNEEIRGYYTRYGKRTVDKDVYYSRVK